MRRCTTGRYRTKRSKIKSFSHNRFSGTQTEFVDCHVPGTREDVKTASSVLKHKLTESHSHVGSGKTKLAPFNSLKTPTRKKKTTPGVAPRNTKVSVHH